MMFADIVVVEEFNNRLDEWMLALEGKGIGIRISRSKTVNVEYEFKRRGQEFD